MRVQAKLVVGASNDQYEREADTIADQVMATIQRGGAEPATAVPGVRLGTVSRISRMPSIGSAGGDVDADTEQAISAARSGGRALDPTVRRSMEAAMGADFSRVRVHVGRQSDELNSRIQARAFTTGSDVFVRRQDYNPTSSAGQRLLAHELAHTVQQGGAPVVQRMPLTGVIQRDDKSDAEDLEAGDRAVNPFYGHALGRHGPDVTDDALKKRLKTGEAPDGEMVPVAGALATTGISSKFASHKVYIDTRAAAWALAKTRLDDTADHLFDLAAKAKKAIEDFNAAAPTEKKTAAADKGKAMKALTEDADGTRLAKNGDKWAPIDMAAKGKIEGMVRLGGDELNGLFTLRPEYELVMEHAAPIGYGFQGVSPQNIPKPGAAGKEMRVFDDAVPLKLDMKKTRSTFKVVGSTVLRGKAYSPSTWAFIQHFPADDDPGMRIKGAT